MAKTAKKVEEVIVSLTEDEAFSLADEFISISDELVRPKGGGQYDEETIERIGSAVREVLRFGGVYVS